ncbi:MAG TPA: endo-1,4-beta-xylanase [Phycisphaerae bacterium]|nr:endo-1,4-beta-xylanase [Phycisphaerae bacterium]
MLRFRVFVDGAPAKGLDLQGAHLLGSDRTPIRADLKFTGGQLVCEPKTRGAAALAILWPVKGLGRVMLETPRLLERKEPYHLHVELARGQLMRISQKREDWGLYDFNEGQALYDEVDAARDQLVAAMTAADDASAARQADEALAAGVKVGESIGAFHADVFLKRRRAAGQLSRRPMGIRLEAAQCFPSGGQSGTVPPAYGPKLVEAFDFISVPFRWGSCEPREGKHAMGAMEAWLRWAREKRLHVWGSSLVSFSLGDLPDWVRVGPKEFEKLRDMVMRHVRHTVKTFGPYVQAWEVATGIHAHNPFKLTFEQLMELTRLSATMARQASPRSSILLGIQLPWGEYYAEDAQTALPLLYAEIAVQSGIHFDAFGLELLFSGDGAGNWVRDFMQISSLIDRFGNLGKPLHITATAAPSSAGAAQSGEWRGPWSEAVQAEWARELYRIAFSKPFVETVTWASPADRAPDSPGCGLFKADGSPKLVFDELMFLRGSVLGIRAREAAPAE